MSGSTHVATTWAIVTRNEARARGGHVTMMNLACQAEEPGINAKGTREPWKVWSKDRARVEC